MYYKYLLVNILKFTALFFIIRYPPGNIRLNMELLSAFFLVLFCVHFDGIKSYHRTLRNETNTSTPTVDLFSEIPFFSTTLGEAQQNETEDIYIPRRNKSRITIVNATTATESTTDPSEHDSLQDISFQNLLYSGINGNEKIIGEINDFPTSFSTYFKNLILTTSGYYFYKNRTKYNMNKGYIVYHNVRVSEWYDNSNNNNQTFSVSFRCDSPSTAKIRVGLPANIKILANFSVTHPLLKTTSQGGITIVIKNGTITKQFNDTREITRYPYQHEDIFSQISYTSSKVDIEFDGPQTLIYKKLEAFFDEIELSLGEFFVRQLDDRMEEHNLQEYLLSDCAKIQFSNLSPQNYLNRKPNNSSDDLYVIPEVKIETWKGILLSVGPIVIDGFSINSTELFISRNYDPYKYGPKNKKQFGSRIKTGNLKGKFQWNYNIDNENVDISSSVFYFSIENILFENEIRNYCCGSINVYIGKTKIKSFSSDSDIKEVKFAKFVLSEYLKSAIAESLRTSLSTINGDTKLNATTVFNNI